MQYNKPIPKKPSYLPYRQLRNKASGKQNRNDGYLPYRQLRNVTTSEKTGNFLLSAV